VKVIFVVGSTASGKSDYALARAEQKHGAIVNCDSIQLYQGLEIGSALPAPEDQKRVPHFLFSYVPKGEKMTAGKYRRDFYELMKKIENQFAEILVVGGTGFYFQAIEKGMFPVGAANPEVRLAIEEKLKTEAGAEDVYRQFQSLDPQAAQKISANDHYRLARAMELMTVQGKTLTQIKAEFQQKKSDFPWPLEKIGLRLAKEELLQRVRLRTEKMLARGLIEEVRGLMQEGLADWEPLNSVGYKETREFLKGSAEIPDEKALTEKIILNTMKLAKKQRTWFQRDPEIHWL